MADEPSRDEILDALFVDVRKGLYNVRWDEETGEPLFSLTEKGKRAAIQTINDLTAVEG